MKRNLVPLVFWLLVINFALIVSQFTIKEKVEGLLKKFLLLTGASATGFFVFAVLHNAFYALAAVASQIFLLNSLLEGLHAAFFLISVVVCPLGFLVGIVGSITFLSR